MYAWMDLTGHHINHLYSLAGLQRLNSQTLAQGEADSRI